MLYITKRVHFSASHRLFNPTFNDQKNDEIYDKCNNFYGHGHNYILEVTVRGIPNPQTGYVIDLKKLKRILNDTIVDKVDHKHLNFDVDFLKGVITSVENLAVIFWKILKEEIKEAELYKIKLYETENSYVEYFGEPVEVNRF
ncbi:MAG: 6-carboxytetrahydropterin synthase [Candidatus Kapabacteria bacterium]|nr:6-carboxytetrahydropterin synthase [Candidatus Kapabacteria bacterium]